MFCSFLLCNGVNQLYVYINLLPLEPPSHPGPISPLQVISEPWALCSIRQLLTSCLLYSWACIYLKKGMETHSSIFSGSPWTEKPGGLQSMGSQRVGRDGTLTLSLFSVYVSVLLSQFISPIPYYVHTSILYVCTSIPTLKTFKIIQIRLESVCLIF